MLKRKLEFNRRNGAVFIHRKRSQRTANGRCKEQPNNNSDDDDDDDDDETKEERNQKIDFNQRRRNAIGPSLIKRKENSTPKIKENKKIKRCARLMMASAIDGNLINFVISIYFFLFVFFFFVCLRFTLVKKLYRVLLSC